MIFLCGCAVLLYYAIVNIYSSIVSVLFPTEDTFQTFKLNFSSNLFKSFSPQFIIPVILFLQQTIICSLKQKLFLMLCLSKAIKYSISRLKNWQMIFQSIKFAIKKIVLSMINVVDKDCFCCFKKNN